MALLAVLTQNPRTLLSKQQLLDEIWGGQEVSEGALAQCLLDIRRALGDDDHRILRNVPRRGYVFDLDVSRDGVTSAKEKGGPWRWLVVAATLAILAAVALVFVDTKQSPSTGDRQVSIAVLPFDDMSEDGDQQFFADGIAEEILNELAQIPNLRVVARTSSFTFRDQTPDIPTIARVLDVTHVLEGSVRREGDRFRITTQLIDGARDAHVWSNAYDAELGSILETQTQIAMAVAEQLHFSLAESISKREVNPQAYQHYLQGQYFYDRRLPGDLQRAEEEFRLAIELDSNFAEPLVGVTAVFSLRGREGNLPLQESLAGQRSAILRALELSPDSPEALVRAAFYYGMSGHQQRRNEYLEKAYERGANSPLVLGVMASRFHDQGNADEAFALYRRAVQLDPLGLVNRFNLAALLLLEGRLDDAEQELRAGVEISPSHHAQVAYLFAVIEMERGNYDAALGYAQPVPDPALRQVIEYLAHQELGNEEQAAAIHAALSADNSPGAAVAIASIAAYSKDVDQAFEWLEIAADRASDSYSELLVFRHDIVSEYFLFGLRNDPRWSELDQKTHAALTSFVSSDADQRAKP